MLAGFSPWCPEVDEGDAGEVGGEEILEMGGGGDDVVVGGAHGGGSSAVSFSGFQQFRPNPNHRLSYHRGHAILRHHPVLREL